MFPPSSNLAPLLLPGPPVLRGAQPFWGTAPPFSRLPRQVVRTIPQINLRSGGLKRPLPILADALCPVKHFPCLAGSCLTLFARRTDAAGTPFVSGRFCDLTRSPSSLGKIFHGFFPGFGYASKRAESRLRLSPSGYVSRRRSWQEKGTESRRAKQAPEKISGACSLRAFLTARLDPAD